jgi:multiple sugar transport system permease protein
LRTNTRTRIAYYAGMALVLLFFAFPLLWVLSLSLKTGPETLQSPPTLLPAEPQWGNYLRVLETTSIGRYLVNSLLIVTLTVGGSLLLGIPAAYALSRFTFRGAKTYSSGLLAAQLVSPVIVAVPLYQVFVATNLIDSYVGLVLVYIALTAPFLTWFLKNYFDTIPVVLDEAGTIDGASRLGVLMHVVLPSARPGIASAAIIGGVTAWSQFVLPLILLDSTDLFPVSVGVVNLQATTGEIAIQYVAAGSVLAVAPVILLFLVLQRHILGALTAGAVKG